jgi:hypothetical protein
MNTAKSIITSALLSLSLVISAQAAVLVGDNVLSNGGFENDGDGWTFDGYSGVTGGFDFDDGGTFGWKTAFFKDNADSAASIRTDVNLQQGYSYQLSFYATVPWTPGNAPVNFEIRDAANDNWIWGGNFTLAAAQHEGGWSSSMVQFTAATLANITYDGTYSLIIKPLEYWGGNDIAFDNVALMVTAVPEPSTYAMILSGIATLLLIRRRVQA